MDVAREQTLSESFDYLVDKMELDAQCVMNN